MSESTYPPSISYFEFNNKKFRIKWDELWNRYTIEKKGFLGWGTFSHYMFQSYPSAVNYLMSYKQI